MVLFIEVRIVSESHLIANNIQLIVSVSCKGLCRF